MNVIVYGLNCVPSVALKSVAFNPSWHLLLDEKIVPAKKLSALVSEAGELVAIFITILKKARGQA